jgi:DNA mismatch repair protein MutS2
MDKDTLHDLEFQRITAMVEDACRTSASASMARAMHPMHDKPLLEKILQELHEYTTGIRHGNHIPDDAFEDCGASLALLQTPGSVLHEPQLFSLRGMHVAAAKAFHFFTHQAETFPRLSRWFRGIKNDNTPTRVIDAILDERGEMRSDASQELQRIRAEMNRLKKESEKSFRASIRQLQNLGWLREQEESFYHGRRVLAVPAEYKNEVKGVVHGSSESGKTVFIEPLLTLECNHRLSALEQDEKKEIYRILRQTADLLRPCCKHLLDGLDLLIRLDFVRAKAKVSLLLNGQLPELSASPELHLKEALHPLLFLRCKNENKQVVPLSIALNPTNRILVISGPNAGGKSIALKTAGLCILMLQSGMLIPCRADSKMGIFKNVLSDIGDSQSIDNGLSTYSSRLQKMKHFLKEANSRTFFLCDELGTGTDPELGGAIAEAFLEEMARRNSLGIVTTHYSNIKILAGKHPGMLNAAMLFHTENLSPLFQLVTGNPGSSFTFEVAEKTGLPEPVLSRARKKISRNKLKLNSLLGELQHNKHVLEKQLEELKKKEAAAEAAHKKYSELQDKLLKKLERDKEKQQETERLTDMGKKFMEFSEEWNGAKNKKEIIQKFIARLTAEKHRKIAREAEEKAKNTREKRIERILKKIEVGSRVRILNSRETGIVQEIKKQKAKVLTGSLISTVSLENLEIVSEK